jgi:isopenicillin N synthase-like dioxygenase
LLQAYIIGAEVPPDDPEAGTFSIGPNMWPKTLPDDHFRKPIMAYQSKMIELVKVLLKVLSLGLPKDWGCPTDALCPLAYGRPSIPMRLIHYAPQEVLDERQFGGKYYRT